MDSFKHNYQYLNSSKLKLDWETLKKEINQICQSKINSVEVLEKHLFTLNELDILVEDMEARLYVKTMQNTADEEAQKRKKDFHAAVLTDFEVQRKLANSAIMQSEFFNLLINKKPAYKILYDKLKNEKHEISSEVSELNVQIAAKVSEYDQLLSSMTIELAGEQKPLIIAYNTKLKDTDRAKRKTAYQAIKQKEKQFINQ